MWLCGLTRSSRGSAAVRIAPVVGAGSAGLVLGLALGEGWIGPFSAGLLAGGALLQLLAAARSTQGPKAHCHAGWTSTGLGLLATLTAYAATTGNTHTHTNKQTSK